MPGTGVESALARESLGASWEATGSADPARSRIVAASAGRGTITAVGARGSAGRVGE